MSQSTVSGRVTGSRASLLLSRIIPWAAFPVALLQAGFFVLASPQIAYKLIAIGLAAAQIYLAYAVGKRDNMRLAWLGAGVFVAQCGLFLANLVASEPPLHLRLALVAIAAIYLGTAAACGFLLARLSLPVAAALSGFFASGLVLSETALELLPPARPGYGENISKLVRSMSPEARLGGTNPARGKLKVYYRGDPRGYFQEVDDVRQDQWLLRVAGQSTASLVFPPDDVDKVRVEIARAGQNKRSYIQLDRMGLHVKGGVRYSVSFRARSDRSREAFVGVARAHGDWGGLGLYQKLSLNSNWQSFREEFAAISDDDNAQVFFDLNDSANSVEISGAHLRSLADDSAVEMDPPAGLFAADYRFNTCGCRGPDYAIPKPRGTLRVLLLGGADILGEGMREGAVLSSELERLLKERARSAVNYEVVNCAAAGYGTLQQRLLYQTLGPKYQPDVVVVAGAPGEDMSFWEQRDHGYVQRRHGKLEFLFYTWGAIQQRWHRRPPPDFVKTVSSIRELDGEVRSQGGRLVVFLFRNDSDYRGSTETGRAWNELVPALRKGLRETKIAVLSEDRKAGSAFGFAPNEAAHQGAAHALLGVLEREILTELVATRR